MLAAIGPRLSAAAWLDRTLPNPLRRMLKRG
jgi:hypothetical protein